MTMDDGQQQNGFMASVIRLDTVRTDSLTIMAGAVLTEKMVPFWARAGPVSRAGRHYGHHWNILSKNTSMSKEDSSLNGCIRVSSSALLVSVDSNSKAASILLPPELG